MQQNNHELWPVTVGLVSLVCLRVRRCPTKRCRIRVSEAGGGGVSPYNPRNGPTTLGVTHWLAANPASSTDCSNEAMGLLGPQPIAKESEEVDSSN